MEATSPPKRMTRARAAAKDAAFTPKDATASTATGPTLATKAKATTTKAASASKTSTSTTTKKPVTTTRSTKRKTRPDEEEDEGNQTDAGQQDAMIKPAKTRGRPKKVIESEAESEGEALTETSSTATRATRGRAKKATPAPSSATAVATTASKQGPAKSTRTSTRARKTSAEDTNAEASMSSEPVKKTRPRATAKARKPTGVITTTVSTEPTPGLKSAVSRPASRIGGPVKKTVTFQEPTEKENLMPPAAKKIKSNATETATGMRARPVRKPAAGGRTTRASARTETVSEKRDKSPLSPKKDAQNKSLSRDLESDDELATLEKTPLKALMKSPVKPPAASKLLDLPPVKETDEHVPETSEPAGASALGSPARRPPSSPWKDSLKSPAKKVDAVPSLLFPPKNEEQHMTSPGKTAILQSPAKRPQIPIKSLQPSSHESSDTFRSPIKISLFQSPAKRPTSPFKFHGLSGQPLGHDSDKLFTPKTSSTEVQDTPKELTPEEPVAAETQAEFSLSEQPEEPQVENNSTPLLEFPGRLSAVLPRFADPALKQNPLPAMEAQPAQLESAQAVEIQQEPTVDANNDEINDDPMDLDEPEIEKEEIPKEVPTTPPTPVVNSAFSLREKELDDDMSDSEDELASSGKTLSFAGVPATPTPSTSKTLRGVPSSAAKAASRAIRSVSKGTRLGFPTPSGQLTSSPSKQDKLEERLSPEFKDEGFSLLKENDTAPAESTPSKSYFDEEMRIRAEMENQAAMEAALEADIAAKYDNDDDPDFSIMPITQEDVQLAAEANEMSLMEVDEVKDVHGHDDSVSDASQEYGDENAVPIDPALLGTNASARRLEPATPIRPSAAKAFHTVSKVPLKAADNSTPSFMKNLSASVSRLTSNRPAGLFKNASALLYPSTKGSSSTAVVEEEEEEEQKYPPVTPVKSDIWSAMGTPGRTPRRDLNDSMLRGAVVFVDVHTSDGADASTIFVDLLTQMGARCVKSWPWNPTNANNDGSMAKIGITHVVFKDGGKRTLEKVKETGGVVQCVGVSWVLDCERENRWVHEAPYFIDTSLVPRGGRNRRKSMEPKALANFNGTLVTPMKTNTGPPRDCMTVPNNHVSRRDSTVWMRTPSDHDEDEDAPSEHDWDRAVNMLTPVPKTPAPEAVARFAMDVTPDSPSTLSYDDDDGEREQLLMRTCPPKKSSNTFTDLGEDFMGQNKNPTFIMRLMEARRKSMQFAPKVASPLSKAWN
ncbi:uncharacterized protein GGS25DRAFT_466974 [Hypoxylon fragiforme]|uniref:uncharacterized protein n=1 Tax=Hypoxylon fragiforme TaxID=63214 RepID=UPI0020C60C83|nr:uncharacterized protein GGS25DRAFT_466974 [Hypoxylon fragiforme]KAI2604577.1 hypothetical protein GGS25DRAFT_466974 [Hypoxylon fragiforme]